MELTKMSGFSYLFIYVFGIYIHLGYKTGFVTMDILVTTMYQTCKQTSWFYFLMPPLIKVPEIHPCLKKKVKILK